MWKERNKRVFQAKQLNELQVAALTKEEIDACISAFRISGP
jgi:hypothetical protein